MPAARIPFAKRVQNAVDAFGVKNGTAIPAPPTPEEIVSAGNEAVDRWHNAHAAVRDLLIMGIVKKHAEARYEKAKDAFIKNSNLDLSKLAIGSTSAFVYGNVSIAIKVNNPQRRIDREKVFTALVTKQKMSVDEATAFIEACENEGKPPVYYTPATIVE
jgi:hypothetical protein